MKALAWWMAVWGVTVVLARAYEPIGRALYTVLEVAVRYAVARG